MSVFVHLTQEKNIKNIMRNGIKESDIHYPDASRGVFCMPVLEDYFVSHQWARELIRFEKKNIVAVISGLKMTRRYGMAFTLINILWD